MVQHDTVQEPETHRISKYGHADKGIIFPCTEFWDQRNKIDRALGVYAKELAEKFRLVDHVRQAALGSIQSHDVRWSIDDISRSLLLMLSASHISTLVIADPHRYWRGR